MEGGARGRPGGPAGPCAPPAHRRTQVRVPSDPGSSLCRRPAPVPIPPPPVPLPGSRTWRRPCPSRPRPSRRSPLVPVAPAPPLTASCSRGAPAAIGGSAHCSTARRRRQLGSAPPPAAAGAGHGGASAGLAGEAAGAAPALGGPFWGSPGLGSAPRPEQAPLRRCRGCLGSFRGSCAGAAPGSPRVGAGNGRFPTRPLRPRTALSLPDPPSPQKVMR